MRAPAIQWYYRDWMSHPGLRMCSISARGLFADMMCIMAEGTPHGYLAVNGKGILPSALARRVGESLSEVERWLTELLEHEVCARDQNGVIYSPRMVRAETLRQVRAAGGPKSQDNPNVPRKKRPDKVGSKDIQEGGGKDTSRPSPAVAVASAVASPPPPRSGAQSSQGSTCQTMVSVVPGEFRPDMQNLLDLVPNVTAWTAEMRAALEGMHGKPITFAQLGQAVRDYLASGKVKNPGPSLRSFRRYMQGVLEVNAAAPQLNGNGKRTGPREYDYTKTTDRIEDVKWQT